MSAFQQDRSGALAVCMLLLTIGTTFAQENSTGELLTFMTDLFSEPRTFSMDRDLVLGLEELTEQVFPWTSRAGPGSRLDALLPRELSNGVFGRDSLRGAPNTTDMFQSAGSDTQCGRLKGEVLAGIDAALQSAEGFTARRGYKDWGFLRNDNCQEQNCALANPSSPYGLFMLPPLKERARGFGALLDAFRPTLRGSGSDSQNVLPWRSAMSRRPGDDIGNARDDESAAYQLSAGEVVVAAGCLPPGELSRYFGLTGYLHSKSSDRFFRDWTTVFGSLGDTLSIHTDPSSKGARNGLNSSLPGSSNPSDEPYGQFTVVLMSASRASVQRVQDLIAPVLAERGLSRSVNVIPIPFPFNEEQTIDLPPPATSPFFLLLARNIVPQGQLEAFKEYTRGHPFSVWRVTPSSPAGRWDPQGPDAYPTPTVKPRTPPTGPPKIKGLEGLDPSLVRAGARGENVLEPAFWWLLERVDDELDGNIMGGAQSRMWPAASRGAASPAWGFGSESGLGTAGIDWGIDCYNREVELCSGDNRDATYVLSLPLVQLDATNKVLYLIGVNHVETGMATFTNIAPTDVAVRLGLEAFSDREMKGSADELMKVGPYEQMSRYFFAVAFSRNCTDVPNCKVLPRTGPRSLPDSNRALLMLRAYVSPHTGVGPAAEDLLKFRAVVATPARIAGVRDYRPRYDVDVLGSSGCRRAFMQIATRCAGDLSLWGPEGSSSSLIVDALSLGEGVLGEGELDFDYSRLRDSECCQATTEWIDKKCNCGQGAQELLGTPNGGVLISSLSRVCGTGTGMYLQCL